MEREYSSKAIIQSDGGSFFIYFVSCNPNKYIMYICSSKKFLIILWKEKTANYKIDIQILEKSYINWNKL